MTERLLQYIWQFQYFSKQEMFTDGLDPQPVQIIYPGMFNTNQGPDFLGARIRIGDEVWAGHVELHVKSSEWAKHKHQFDENYNNVVLHAVWENDLPEDHYQPPMIVLSPRVSKMLLGRYEDFMLNPASIPCGNRISEVQELVWMKWKERMMIERLEQKTGQIMHLLEESRNSWDEVFWWQLARNFGFTVNSEAFLLLARSIPYNLLTKHSGQIHQVEALLFGQSGLLAGKFTESYPTMLKKEYHFLKKKYSLEGIFAPIHFLRMRPVNFPTIRLAQLAILVCGGERIFSRLLESGTVAALKDIFMVTANDYWHYHYRFEETTAYLPKKLGAQMFTNLVINTVVPMVFAYGTYHKDLKLRDRAIEWLNQLQAEDNRIVSGFSSLGIESVSAFDTQSVYHLRKNYCDEKRCLECAVGNSLLNTKHGGN